MRNAEACGGVGRICVGHIELTDHLFANFDSKPEIFSKDEHVKFIHHRFSIDLATFGSKQPLDCRTDRNAVIFQTACHRQILLRRPIRVKRLGHCLLYTSDAADE